MSRVAHLCLGLALSAAGSGGIAHAYDQRVDPNAAQRAEMGVAFDREPMRALGDRAGGQISSDAPRLPIGYAPAMTWYRVALAEGFPQPPIVASQWSYDEQLPEPLHWAWMAPNGDLVTRVGKGVFQLSTADSRSNWFRELNCKLMSWPGGDSAAPMMCDDGVQRTMQIPGDGLVRVDGVEYARAFPSEITVLPRHETVEEIMARQDMAATAAVGGEAAEPAGAAEAPPVAAQAPAPAKVPIPRPRPANP